MTRRLTEKQGKGHGWPARQAGLENLGKQTGIRGISRADGAVEGENGCSDSVQRGGFWVEREGILLIMYCTYKDMCPPKSPTHCAFWYGDRFLTQYQVRAVLPWQ